METESKIPDYVGSWNIWRSLSGKEYLKIFITEKKTYKSKLEKIKGVLNDDWGIANVTGEIHPKYLDLLVEYFPEVFERGNHPKKIRLNGKFEEGIYIGFWKDKNGKERDFVIEKVNTFFRDYHLRA